MASKKPTAAQLAARKRFAEMAKAGVFTRKRAGNPSPRTRRQTQGNHNGVFTVVDWEPARNTSSGNPVFRFTLRDSHGTHYRGKTKGNAGFVYGLPSWMSEGQKIDAKLSVSPMGTVTMIDGDLIKDNPKARKSVKPVTRPSQATGKRPSKRLLARRKATAKAPPGFYANPIAPMDRRGKAEKHLFVYLVEYWWASAGAWQVVAGFDNFKEAGDYAHAYARVHPTRTIRVVDNLK